MHNKIYQMYIKYSAHLQINYITKNNNVYNLEFRF